MCVDAIIHELSYSESTKVMITMVNLITYLCIIFSRANNQVLTNISYILVVIPM